MYNQDEQDNQDQDNQAEQAYREFMEAVSDGDTQALQVIEANAWEFMEACMGRRKELWSIVVGGWRTPTAKEDEGTGKDAPRFQTDEDDVWITHQTPTEADEVIPYYTLPMPYPEDLDDEDANEDLDDGWVYVRTPEDEYIAIAPNKRAFRAFIRGDLIGRRYQVIRVIYRR